MRARARLTLTRVREHIEAAMARTLTRVPPHVLARLVGASAPRHGEHRLDVQVHWADLLRRLARHRPLEHGSIERARREYRRMALLERPAPVLASVESLRLALDHAELSARIYRSSHDVRAPAVLYLHGGGGVIGDLDTHDVLCRTFAQRTGAVVLAIDYRLAPEHPYTAAAEDAFGAYAWLHAHADALGVDRGRIGVAGDSRGGKLATVVCLLARAHGVPQPKVQVLVYPSIDAVEHYPRANSSRTRRGSAPS